MCVYIYIPLSPSVYTNVWVCIHVCMRVYSRRLLQLERQLQQGTDHALSTLNPKRQTHTKPISAYR